jgi:hypothetical protein
MEHNNISRRDTDYGLDFTPELQIILPRDVMHPHLSLTPANTAHN